MNLEAGHGSANLNLSPLETKGRRWNTESSFDYISQLCPKAELELEDKCILAVTIYLSLEETFIFIKCL